MYTDTSQKLHLIIMRISRNFRRIFLNNESLFSDRHVDETRIQMKKNTRGCLLFRRQCL